MLHLLFAAAVASAACPSSDDACVRASMDQGLKLNDLTAVGTHNSYKQPLPAQELAAMVAAAGQRALGIDYGHRPLTDQLNDGARQLEIDVAQDAAGGLYAKPKTATGQGEALSPANAAVMAKPGYKVLHMQDVDFRSTCLTFVACLGEVRAWSKANPNHAPILILINAKEGGPNLPGGVIAPTYDAEAFDALDAEIRTVFSDADLITPDQVQGKKPTLREAVLAGGWPTLAAVRGKVFFALDETPAKVALYRGARRSLEGRAMFINTDEASPAAAYLTLNDPIAERARIQAAVKAGFVVRTRADADTWEARANDPRRRSAAFSSGAQYVSTDYMRPDPRFDGGYFARLPGGAAAVCNLVRAVDRCRGLAIEADKGAPVRGYLAPAERPDLTVVLAQPPAAGSPKALADAAIFRDTRALQGTARWALATSDVTGDMYDHFAQALGVRINPEQAPILTALLARSGDDRSVVGVAKTHWGTKRPYLGTDLAICEAKSDHLAGNPDYPSGHSAHGMHVGLILAALAPQRKTELLARGREYAESRYVCGSHSYSAAEAGIISGMAIFTAEHASPLFRQDMDAARAEVAVALSAGPSKPADQ